VTSPPKLESVITCPLCGTQARENMPENACQHFYRCTGCRGDAPATRWRLLRVLFLQRHALPADAGDIAGMLVGYATGSGPSVVTATTSLIGSDAAAAWSRDRRGHRRRRRVSERCFASR
jgi:hypothetical protein